MMRWRWRDFAQQRIATITKRFIGTDLKLGTGKIAQQTESSVVGQEGSTVVISTVACEHQNIQNEGGFSSLPFLTVDYRERFHAVGKIPTHTRARRDNTMLSVPEILASRVIDRALRPVLIAPTEPSSQQRVHVSCSVQSHSEEKVTSLTLHTKEYEMPSSSVKVVVNPIALALNAASTALWRAGFLSQPVAAVALTDENEESLLLYAGTKENTCMLEYSANVLTSKHSIDLPSWFETGHAAIQPILQQMEEDFAAGRELNNSNDDRTELGAPEITDEELRIALGLAECENKAEKISKTDSEWRSEIISLLINRVQEDLGSAPCLLFGGSRENDDRPRSTSSKALIHNEQSQQKLLSRKLRGRREHLLQTEIQRLVRKHVDRFCSGEEKVPDIDNDTFNWLSTRVSKHLLKKGFVEAALEGNRADGRGSQQGEGWRTVRPIEIQVPALPVAVHGSSCFRRGDTQVLCTVTLGPPSDGQPISDPFQITTVDERSCPSPNPKSGYYELPVGSLRFLRTQENLVSDLNSLRSKAEKELLGASGNLTKVQRAFLQYDFPAYSTGSVPVGSLAHNRRAIGHGALAERGLMPVLPHVHDFPYAIRMTSEVTDSNGSSSMASVCGCTMALLDAGVPLQDFAAGVSVGLALEPRNGGHRFLLDITGTEDHYGAMDFKIAGTRDDVTAMQLDVKELFDRQLIVDALDIAKSGRRVILDEMEVRGGLKPRAVPKSSAPRVEVVRFDPQRKRDLVGPGGIILRQLEDRYGVSVDLTQEGTCLMFGSDTELVKQAKATVMDLVADVEPGQVYEGIIIETKDFGAIVELLRNKEGLLHVSEITDEAEVEDHPGGISGFVNQYVRVGQRVEVLCTEVDPVQGSIKLSRKALLQKTRESSRNRRNRKRS